MDSDSGIDGDDDWLFLLKDDAAITKVLFEDAAKLPIGRVVMAPGFRYEDAMTAIDVGDPRMDRGMLRVRDADHQEYWLQELWQDILAGRRIAFPDHSDPRQLYWRLFRLEVEWLLNLGSFADALATCMSLHQLSVIQSKPLKFFLQVQLHLCDAIASVVGSAAVTAASDEDFSINLCGTVGRNRWELREDLRDCYVADDGDPYVKRIWLWWQFWRILSTISGNNCRINNNGFDSHAHIIQAKSLLDQLATIILQDDAASNIDSSSPDEAVGIFPVMTNVFGSGCPRRPIPPLPLDEAWKRWDELLKDLQRVFTLVMNHGDLFKGNKNEDLTTSPWDLVKGILVLQGPQGMSAIPRSILFSLLLAAHQVNLGGHTVLLDAIQIVCHSLARQHRLIPKLLKRGIHGTVRTFAIRLAIWHILLGFKLDLYEPFEVFEALWIATKLAKECGIDFLPNLSRISNGHSSPKASPLNVYDDCRFLHRWECQLALLQSVEGCSKPLYAFYQDCMNDRGSSTSLLLFPANCHLWESLYNAFLL